VKAVLADLPQLQAKIKAAIDLVQRIALIGELRRYDSVLIVIDFAGQGALKSCDAALN
jgi:hypothetical protein